MIAPEKPVLHETPLVLVSIMGSVLFVLLVAGLVVAVTFEQRQRREQRSIPLVSPRPLAQRSPVASPTPRLLYQPNIAGLSRSEAIGIFLTVSGLSKPGEEKGLARWQQEEIIAALRGQPAAADITCVDTIARELNPVLEASKLVVQKRENAPFEIYILPRNQFSSVEVDVPADRKSFLSYRDNASTGITKATLLIDADLSSEERCWYIRARTMQALGLLSFSDHPTMLKSYLGTTGAPLGSVYSSQDLEMARILYSPLLTAGLTRVEVERRLLQE